METPRLNLPLVAAGQSQKHVTVNEALLRLDTLVQLTVESATLAAPPAGASEGQSWIVPPGATGLWAGRAAQIATWRDDGWSFIVAEAGHRAHVADRGDTLLFDGAAWVAPALRPGSIGVNAAPDAVNRLSVAADGVLFSHAGGDMRAALNKAALADTASVLFQSAFSGRAEIGLGGEDALSFKVSADGALWRTALTAEPGGQIRQPHQPFVSARGLSLVPAHGANRLIHPDAGANTGCYNPATGIFTAPVAGLYAFQISALTEQRSATYEVFVYQDGINVGRAAYLDSLPTAQYRHVAAHVVLTLSAGEIVEFVTTRPIGDWSALSDFTNSLIARMIT